MAPIHQRIAPFRVFNVILRPALGEMPFDIADDGRHVIPLIVGQIVLVGAFDLDDPAAGFVQVAHEEAGAETVELNLEPSSGATLFDHSRYGPATELVPAFVEALLTQ